MTTPLDLEWARRCAKDFADKPTEARARNAAQCLAGLLLALDTLQSAYNALAGGWVAPPEPCRNEHEGLTCYLVAGHTGDHSTNVRHREPATWPRTEHDQPPEAWREQREAAIRDMAAKLDMPPEIAANPDAYTWRKAGIDPCPARSHQNETCLKGYLHTGGHEWGGTRGIVAGPELPDEHCCPAHRKIGPQPGWCANATVDGCEPCCEKCPDGALPGLEPGLDLGENVRMVRGCIHGVAGCHEPDKWHRHDGKSPCERVNCDNWTSLTCNNCERNLCRQHVARHRETGKHPGEVSCDKIVCRYKGCETPREDPGHLHSAAPFGAISERRAKELQDRSGQI